MAEAPTDRHHVEPGCDQRRRMRMTEGVEHDRGELAVADDVAPVAAELVGRIGRAIRERENEIRGTWPAEPQ